MTTENEELAFDSDGIPILTDIVYDDDATENAPGYRPERISADELARELLQSDAFRQRLDELATGLARDVRQQLEHALRPVIDVAISHALESGDNGSRQVIRRQLETALPELLAKTLQK